MSKERETFEILLDQIAAAPNLRQHPLMQTAQIKQVTVHRQSKAWTFYFQFERLLPVMVYQSFKQHIELAFKEIAEVRIIIEAQDGSFDEQFIQEYWPLALANQNCDRPLVHQVIKNQMPVLQENKVILPVNNDAVITILQQQYLPIIEENYSTFGFQKFRILPQLDQEQAEAALKELEARKEEQTAAFQQQAAENLMAHEQRKKEVKTVEFDGPIALGRNIPADEPVTPMINIIEEERRVTIQGYVFDKEVRELRSKRKILILKITDYTSSFSVKKFSNNEKDEQVFDAIAKGSWVKVRGSVQEDTFMRDLVMNAQDLLEVKHEARKDYAPEGEKRVELHLHSNMSTMDATNNVADFVAQAGKWGHKAIAITDHGGAQGFPDAHHAGEKAGVKILYGVEANIVDDGVAVAYNPQPVPLTDATYIVFDVETTGLSAVYDTIIELAAVRMHKGNVEASFDEFIDPGHPLSRTTVELTGITDEMVRGSKSEEEVLRLFREFSEGAILVAHNASFDMGFLNTSYRKYGIPEAENPVIDTLELARYLYPEFKRFGLGVLSKKFGVSLEQHHRAIYDAEATGHLAWIFVKEAMEKHEMLLHEELNRHVGGENSYKAARPFHATILARTQAGLKNLFKLISMSNVKYFHDKVPRIPRSELVKLREGLLVGTACDKGEVFVAMMQKGSMQHENLPSFMTTSKSCPKQFMPIFWKRNS